MHWYSASAWEHHTCKHIQDNLPIHPKNPAFYQQFSEAEAIPSTSKLTSDLPQANIISERAKAAMQFLEEGDNESTLPPWEHVHSSFEIQKHHVKQGSIKSSKKFKVAEPKGDNE